MSVFEAATGDAETVGEVAVVAAPDPGEGNLWGSGRAARGRGCESSAVEESGWWNERFGG